MSEVVLRMELPDCCDDCPMNYDGIACRATDRRFYERNGQRVIDCVIDTAEERFPDCPIICSLPEGHGRLVDEKSVRWAIDDIVLEIANRTGRVGMTKDETMEYINSLCTIVPAERSET